MFFYVLDDESTRKIKFTLEKFDKYNKNVIAFYGCDEDFIAPVQYNYGDYEQKGILNVGMKSIYQNYKDIYVDKTGSSEQYTTIPIINRFILKESDTNNTEYRVLNYNWLQFEGNYIMSDDKINHYMKDLTYTGRWNQKINLTQKKGILILRFKNV